MVVTFYKYQGTGNDFVLIDDRKGSFDIEAHKLIKKICDRKFGIGADGLILIRNHDKADFEMVYFNADGYQTSLCGNGSRCAVKFAKELGIINESCSFQTIEGILNASIEDDNIFINMPDVKHIEEFDGDFYLNTGSPHYIRFVENLDKYDVYSEGKKIRYSEKYKSSGGTNANFLETEDNSSISVRTYERGVENETYSCGTGVTAAAIVYGKLKNINKVQVKTLGGELSVMFDNVNGEYKNVFLKGPAVFVFKGEIDIKKL